jgi:cysteine synthase A
MSSLSAQINDVRHVLRRAPIVKLFDERLNLYAKLEQFNGIGSIKDRPAYYILKSAIESGEVDAGSVVVESSSGNFAVALAVFCRMTGLPFIAVIDENISPAKELSLRLHCSQVERVTAPDVSGGFLLARLQRVRELCSELPRPFWPNQYGNPEGMRAHYELTAGEICDEVPNLDYAIVGVSSAGTIAGVSRRLKERYPHVRVIAVDAEGSAIFGSPPKRRYIPGIGSSIVPDLLQHAAINEIMSIPETETVDACLELFAQHGLFVGGSSGSAYAAVKRLRGRLRGNVKPDVLFFCCDSGVGYIDTIYNASWRAWRLSVEKEGRESIRGHPRCRPSPRICLAGSYPAGRCSTRAVLSPPKAKLLLKA